MKKIVLLLISHGLAIALGFAGGIYALPILVAPPSPSLAEVERMEAGALYSAEFTRDLIGSDRLHWGEGKVSIHSDSISLQGRLAPGPDYKLYLSPAFVETEDEFFSLKPQMVQVGDVKTFDNFIVTLPEGVMPDAYNSVVVWCESFGQFITAAQYQ